MSSAVFKAMVILSKRLTTLLIMVSCLNSTLQRSALQRSAVQRSAVQHIAVQCNNALLANYVSSPPNLRFPTFPEMLDAFCINPGIPACKKYS